MTMKILSVIATFVVMALAAPAHARPLTLCVEDVPQPPWTTPEQTGLNFELLERVQKATGEHFEIAAKPWRRCLEDLRHGVVDGLIGAAYSPDRRMFAHFPMLGNGQVDSESALFVGRTYVFLRVGGLARWDGRKLHNPRNTVIAQRSYMAGERLRRQGFAVLDDAKTPEDGLRRLVAEGGADVAVIHSELAHYLVNTDPRFKGRVVEAQPPFDASPHFLVFSPDAYKAHRGRIERIWSAIAQVRRSPEYRRIESATILRTQRQGPQ